jgi:hypothetical protein
MALDQPDERHFGLRAGAGFAGLKAALGNADAGLRRFPHSPDEAAILSAPAPIED